MGKGSIKPRVSRFMGMREEAHHGANGTWLEAESICYPSGAMIRRCRAKVCHTDKLRVIRCGVADAFFSIPARQGFITCDEGTYVFHADTSLAQMAGFRITG